MVDLIQVNIHMIFGTRWVAGFTKFFIPWESYLFYFLNLNFFFLFRIYNGVVIYCQEEISTINIQSHFPTMECFLDERKPTCFRFTSYMVYSPNKKILFIGYVLNISFVSHKNYAKHVLSACYSQLVSTLCTALK